MWVMKVELIFPKFFNNLFMQFGSWWHGGWLCFNGERGFWGGVVIQVAGSLHDGSLDGFHNGGSLNLGR